MLSKTPHSNTSFSTSSKKNTAITLHEIASSNEERYVTKDIELNRVLGGGIVPGSLVLFGGEPGIGKSTLLLQLCTAEKLKILYVSGEESTQQIKMRADRIGIQNENCFILTETNTQQIFKQIEQIQPELLIIDSIPVLKVN